MILLPSDLLILKEKIPGYNNTLTTATKSMSFGKNAELNFSDPADTEGDTQGDPADPAESSAPPDPADDDAEDADTQDDEGDDNDKKEPEFDPFRDKKPKEPKERPKSSKKRLGYVVGEKKNKELIAVFSVMSVFGALGFRFLAS